LENAHDYLGFFKKWESPARLGIGKGRYGNFSLAELASLPDERYNGSDI
jgi:hypothetical protein